jgi:molybdate transport system substrate-binding protein
MKITRLVITALFFLIPNIANANQIKNLTIFAEPNMMKAITKIARIYSQKNSVIVSASFNSSPAEFISDIDLGEPADVFISGNPKWINILKQKGLVDVYNINYIANDSLALATSKNNLSIPKDLLKTDFTLVKALKILDRLQLTLIIDHEDGTLGKYSKDLLDELQLGSLKIFRKLSEDKTPTTSLINDNQDAYMLLLASQVKNKSGFKLLAHSDPSTIFYQALVIAGDNMESGREFLKFLKTDQAKLIFRDNGFVVD